MSIPRPRGDQGIDPTPNILEISERQVDMWFQSKDHLERREHLALFLSVQQAVVVLHGDERRKVVQDRIVYV